MKDHLTQRYMFSASDRLHSEDFSDERNHATYGKCNNPHGHGHNYTLEVTVSGQVIFENLRQSFRAPYLEKVRLEETMMNSFEYAGGGELRR